MHTYIHAHKTFLCSCSLLLSLVVTVFLLYVYFLSEYNETRKMFTCSDLNYEVDSVVLLQNERLITLLL